MRIGKYTQKRNWVFSSCWVSKIYNRNTEKWVFGSLENLKDPKNDMHWKQRMKLPEKRSSSLTDINLKTKGGKNEK